MNRVFLSIDLSNLYYCVQHKFNSKIDFKKLKEFAEKYGYLSRAIAYGSQLNGQAEMFLETLDRLGYETRFKEPKNFNGRMKANWDIGIAIDIVRNLDRFDTLILATADGDFAECLKFVGERGRKRIIIGSGISEELKSQCEEWYEINSKFLINTATAKSVVMPAHRTRNGPSLAGVNYLDGDGPQRCRNRQANEG